jgi:hypothetical protein
MIRTPIVERSVDLGGVWLNVASAGSGRPVVLLHGFPDSWRLWRYQIRLLAAAGHRVIAPDLRGFGRSSRPSDVADYRMNVLVGDPHRGRGGRSRLGSCVGLAARGQPAGVLNYDRVLPRCRVAVHHGGSGFVGQHRCRPTVAASVTAGIPTFVCSLVADNPFWGAPCRRTGDRCARAVRRP